ncbi:MAG: hypothetical protein ACREKQ_02105 [Candidatus Rokuibacteriota bacterium]
MRIERFEDIAKEFDERVRGIASSYGRVRRCLVTHPVNKFWLEGEDLGGLG